MTYPNAYAGVKKLFISQILELISVILMTITAVLALSATYAAADAAVDEVVIGGLAIGTLTLLVPALICGLIGEILGLVGLWQGGKDSPRFLKPAFWVAIVLLILSVVMGGYTGNNPSAEQSTIVTIGNIVVTALNLAIIDLTINGVRELALKIGRPRLAKRGRTLMIWLTIALVCAIIASAVTNWVGQAAAVVAFILLIVVYFGFIGYLRRAKNALAVR